MAYQGQNAWSCSAALRRTALLLFFPTLLSAAETPPRSTPGAEVFGALPLETNPSIDPEGHWLVWVDHKDPRSRIVVLDIDARKVHRTLASPEGATVTALRWNTNGILLISLSQTGRDGRDYRSLVAQEVSGGAQQVLGSTHTYLVASRTSKPYTSMIATDPPPLTFTGKSIGMSQLMEVDTRTGQGTVVKIGTEHTVAWFVDRDGRPLAREDWDPLGHDYRVLSLGTESVREILRRDDAERPRVAGVLEGDAALALLTGNGRDHQAAWELPLDGSPLRLLAEDPNGDITSVWTDPFSGAVIGVYVSGEDESVHWLDPQAKHRYELLSRAFPGRRVVPYGWSADGTRTLAGVSGPSAPPVFYLTDFKTHRADIAAEEYPALASVALGEVKEIRYKARDGTEIPAYLTLPPEKHAPLPLVVLPHNGPHTRDFLQFDPLVQFLATRGYAVLQPQFRGSTGFGAAFRDAGFHQWGALMQDDVTDGVRAMVDQGIADPQRVCIVGTSAYAGYAALAGVAFTPELFACAVSINGISDLPALMRAMVPDRARRWSAAQSDWIRSVGHPGDSVLRTRSPINAVKSIKAPVLIMSTTESQQSAPMARALAEAGKQVTVKSVPDKWWMSSAARVSVFREIEDFLGQHLQQK